MTKIERGGLKFISSPILLIIPLVLSDVCFHFGS